MKSMQHILNTFVSRKLFVNMTSLRPLWKHGGMLVPRIRNWRIREYSNSGAVRTQRKVDEPLRYTQSKASTWKAEYSRTGYEGIDDTPWYQGLVIYLSLGVFLIYFCIFREESDIDQELGKSLYDRIEGLEEGQLRSSLQYNQQKGLDTQAIEARLKQIEQEKQSRQ